MECWLDYFLDNCGERDMQSSIYINIRMRCSHTWPQNIPSNGRYKRRRSRLGAIKSRSASRIMMPGIFDNIVISW